MSCGDPLIHSPDICPEDDFVCGEEKPSRSRINISACLEARSLYDAAYHRDRDAAVAAPPPPSPVVSLWDYLRLGGVKTGAGLLGRGLQLIMLAVGALIVASGVQNVSEYQRAQPVIHQGTRPLVHLGALPLDRPVVKSPKAEDAPEGIVMDADGPATWSGPSDYKLPRDWEDTNVSRYVMLLSAFLVSCFGGAFCMKWSRRIQPGIPIQYVDTDDLSAQESLVRASQEPVEASLVRGASRPNTSPDTLLRSLGSTHETPPEQLVRAVAGQKQD